MLTGVVMGLDANTVRNESVTQRGALWVARRGKGPSCWSRWEGKQPFEEEAWHVGFSGDASDCSQLVESCEKGTLPRRSLSMGSIPEGHWKLPEGRGRGGGGGEPVGCVETGVKWQLWDTA